MNTMKKILIAAISAAFSLPVVSSDRLYFQSAHSRTEHAESNHAQIDEALSRIIPAPYRIMLDASIPETMILVWRQDEDWMDSLRKAVKPVGLAVKPDWSTNTILVTWQKESPETVQDHKPVQDICAGKSVPPTEAAAIKRDPVPRTSVQGGFDPVHEGAQVFRNAHDHETSSAKSRKETVRTVIVKHTSDLPTTEEIGMLIRAVSEGNRLFLRGFSEARKEKLRVADANRYAEKMRKNLLEIGFPDHSVVVDYCKRHPTKSSPRVEITVVPAKEE